MKENVPITLLSERRQLQVWVVTLTFFTSLVTLRQAQAWATVLEFEAQVKGLLTQQVQRFLLVVPLRYWRQEH